MADTPGWFTDSLLQMEAEYITAEDWRKKLGMSQPRFVFYLRENREDLPLVHIFSDGKIFYYSRFSDDENNLFYDDNTDLEEVIGMIATHEVAIHRNDISEHRKNNSGSAPSTPKDATQQPRPSGPPSAEMLTQSKTKKQQSPVQEIVIECRPTENQQLWVDAEMKNIAKDAEIAELKKMIAEQQQTQSAYQGNNPEAQNQITAWTQEAGTRKSKERKACLLAAAKWDGLDHIEAHKRIAPEPCIDGSRKSYVTAARNVAQQIADYSEGRLIMPPWRQK